MKSIREIIIICDDNAYHKFTVDHHNIKKINLITFMAAKKKAAKKKVAKKAAKKSSKKASKKKKA